MQERRRVHQRSWELQMQVPDGVHRQALREPLPALQPVTMREWRNMHSEGGHQLRMFLCAR